MLQKIRIILASLFWVGITALMLDFTGVLHTYLGWMAKIQFMPAVLAGNFIVIAALAVLTLLFGRVYCSVICPLGITQDLVYKFSMMRSKKAKFRFKYSPAKNWLRYGMLAIFVLLLVLGLGSIAALIEPYSAFGRIVSNLFAPIYQLGNNLLALIDNHFNSYTFYSKDVWIKSLPTFAVAVATLIAIVVLALKGGRTWCNTICPVGTTLGLLSRFSLFGPMIDESKCVNCGMCARGCKGSCIDAKNHRIDHSRCVDCMDCIDNCNSKAIKYRFRYGKKATPATTATAKSSKTSGTSNPGRRAFMTSAVLLAGGAALKAQDMKLDGGLAPIVGKKAPKRETSIVPAGAVSLSHFSSHCIACQLCVGACPNDVLRPSSALGSLMQPELSYEKGFCRPECNKCSEVCPAGAILKVTPEEKTAIHIGHAVVDLKLCVAALEQDDCGNCARHCPSGAIRMVDNGNGFMIPAVNTEKCIGCGACEYLCPARPLSAIHVEGIETHIRS